METSGKRIGRCKCPACGQALAPKSIHEHTKMCLRWRTTYGEPFPYLKYSGHPEHYLDSAVEGRDYVQCKVCLGYGWDFRFRRMMDHLTGLHGLDEASYQAKHPGAPVRLDATLEARKRTVRDHYGVENVFQAEAIKDASRKTLQERHGVTSPMRSEQLRAKAAGTNLDRYGATNPFASGRVKAKIRKTNLERYGVENPNQSPAIIQKRVRTNLERYGAEHFLETPEFKEKFRETSQRHFGTDHPMQSPEGRRLAEESVLQKYGVSHPFLSPTVQAKAYATSVANHGGVHHLSHPDIIEARKAHLLSKYGVDNISKVPAVKERIIARIKERFRDGAIPTMTTPERVFQALVPDRVVYSGDFSYWVTWANGRRKNPDFVVLTDEQYAAYRAGVTLNDLRTYLVVEINGVFWHTAHKGLTREAREEEFIKGYASVGVSCMVIWEDDLETLPLAVQDRVHERLTGK